MGQRQKRQEQLSAYVQERMDAARKVAAGTSDVAERTAATVVLTVWKELEAMNSFLNRLEAEEEAEWHRRCQESEALRRKEEGQG